MPVTCDSGLLSGPPSPPDVVERPAAESTDGVPRDDSSLSAGSAPATATPRPAGCAMLFPFPRIDPVDASVRPRTPGGTRHVLRPIREVLRASRPRRPV